MSEDTRKLYLIVVLLLITSAILILLDWKRQGEIEFLHERVDSIDGRPVARILRARDDATAERVAREAT